MIINKDGVELTRTTIREDKALQDIIDIDYSREELEEIVECVINNNGIDFHYTADVLYAKGYNLLTVEDIAFVEEWLYCSSGMKKSYFIDRK